MCSPFSNKYEKKSTIQAHFHPPCLLISLDLFHPFLLVYCIYVLVFPKKPSLHVYSNLHVYWFCNFSTTFTFTPTSTAVREMGVKILHADYPSKCNINFWNLWILSVNPSFFDGWLDRRRKLKSCTARQKRRQLARNSSLWHAVKSRAIDRSTIQFLSIFGVLLTEMCYTNRGIL